jgi:hypothetical protein
MVLDGDVDVAWHMLEYSFCKLYKVYEIMPMYEFISVKKLTALIVPSSWVRYSNSPR